MDAWVKKNFNLTGYTDVKLRFDYYLDSEDNWDFLRLFVDGSLVWQTSGNYNWDPEFGGSPKEISLPVCNNNPSCEIRFVFTSDGSVNSVSQGVGDSPGAFLDNIEVSGVP